MRKFSQCCQSDVILMSDQKTYKCDICGLECTPIEWKTYMGSGLLEDNDSIFIDEDI